MRPGAIVLGLALALGACQPIGFVNVAEPTGDFVSGQLLVKVKAGATGDAVVAAHHAAGAVPQQDLGDGLWLVTVPSGHEREAMDAYRWQGAIAYAEVNRLLRNQMVGGFRLLDGRTVQMAAPRDPYYAPAAPINPTAPPRPGLTGQQWVFESTKILDAWDKTMGDPQIKVAVLDTGVDMGHEDLVGNLDVADAKNFVETNQKTPDDDFGHGTHVAGIIAAAANNQDSSSHAYVGIAGVANCMIMPIRVLGADGGATSGMIQGLNWAIDHKARVVNLSLGSLQYSKSEEDAIERTIAAGIVVVSAAGNEAVDGNAVSYPAALPGVIAVGAVDSNLARATFSNYNPFVTVSAPGVDILSTIPRLFKSPGSSVIDAPYAYASGTSMAAPVVSGIVALMLSAHPDWNPATVLSHLKSTARDLGPKGTDPFFGAGLVQAGAAVQ